MPKYRTEDIRNITLVGHSGSGKTTLVEALLAKSGKIGEAGTIERGTTTTDHDPLEKEFQSSLDSALASLDFDGIHVNLIDTPGFPDFRGPTLTGMSATETTALVINAHNGIELSTRRLMRRAKRRRLCRIIVINKIDQEGVNLTKLVQDIREEFGPECLPINLPADNLSTVKDCFYGTEGETDIFSLAEAHEAIIDQVVEVNEELMEKYLEGEELSSGRPAQRFRAGAARRPPGSDLFHFSNHRRRPGRIPETLQTPAAQSGGRQSATDPERRRRSCQEVEVKPDPNGHVVAHVFKITNDPFVGKLSIFRIYQGTVRPTPSCSSAMAANRSRSDTCSNCRAPNTRKSIPASPATSAPWPKWRKFTTTPFCTTLMTRIISTSNRWISRSRCTGWQYNPAAGARSKSWRSPFTSLTEEDPCFVVEHNQELNETVIRGLGELHMRVMLQRMNSRYHVEVDTRPPRIAYRETVTRPAEGHYRHKKQTGGAGQFGEVFLRIRPLARGEGFQFVNKVVGGSIPTSLIPGRGKRDPPDHGRGRHRRVPVAGYRSDRLRRQIPPGRFQGNRLRDCRQERLPRRHPQRRPADPGADRQRGRDRARCVMGDVTGNLAGRRARISGTESLSGGQVTVTADMPLSSLSDYHTELKSMSQGQGSFTMEFSHYDPVPHAVQQQLEKDHKPKDND